MSQPRAATRSILVTNAVLVVVLALVAILAIAVTARPAHADPLQDAKNKAKQLQAQVSQLQIRSEQASERYDAAEAGLAQLVADQQRAIRAAEAASATAQLSKVGVYARTRALYTSGGLAGLYASVLDGHDPRQVLDGLHSVEALSDADKHALQVVSSTETTAQQANARVADLSAQQDALTGQAAAAEADAQAALAQEQQSLAASDAQVTKIEAELQAQADAAAAARSSAELTAAQNSARAAGFVLLVATPLAAKAIRAARTQVGKPYVFGGSGPDTWDCSGLTQWAFGQAGVLLPRTAAEQYATVPTKVPLGQLAAGDLLFWATNLADASTIHHVAIYLGDGFMLAAPHTGTDVQIEPVYLDGYFGAVRIG